MIPEGVPYIFASFLTIITIFFVDWRIGICIIIMVPVSMFPAECGDFDDKLPK